ncbi:DUF2177 family protein [Undibacterium sp. Di27W]|uniref:DUF2177 family protein n=1 Tax=Undibacterium sp. Di27W TaxID=3413036 RepID=UPI003BF2C708
MFTLSTAKSPTMQQLLIAYVTTLLAVLALDAVWLGLLMGPSYQSALGDLMLAQPRLIPAALFYLLYALGLLVLGILPALQAQSWQRAACLCGMLGLVAYGTYDLSNLATLKAWPAMLAALDIGWGVALSTIAGTLGYLAGRRFA